MENAQEIYIEVILTVKIITNDRRGFCRYLSSQFLESDLSSIIDLDSFVEMIDSGEFSIPILKKSDFRTDNLKIKKINPEYLKLLLPDNNSLNESSITGYLVLFYGQSNQEINFSEFESRIFDNLNQTLKDDIREVYLGKAYQIKREVNFYETRKSHSSVLETREYSFHSGLYDFYPIIYTKIVDRDYEFLSYPKFLKPHDYLTKYIDVTTKLVESSNILIFITDDNRLFLGKCVPVTDINPDYKKFDKQQRMFKVFIGLVSDQKMPICLPNFQCVQKEIFHKTGDVIKFVHTCMQKKPLFRIEKESIITESIPLSLKLESPTSIPEINYDKLIHKMYVYDQQDTNLEEIWDKVITNCYKKNNYNEVSLCLGLNLEVIQGMKFTSFKNVGCIDYPRNMTIFERLNFNLNY